MFFKIGKIHKTAPPGVEQCADGSFTDARLPGRCSYHGGLLVKTVRAKKREQVVLPDVVQPEVYQTRCAKKRNTLCRDLENKYRQLRAIAEEKNLLINHPMPLSSLRKDDPKGMHLDHLFHKANEGLLRLTVKNQHEERGTENLVIQYLAEIETVISDLIAAKMKKVGQILYQTSPEQYAQYIDNTALATAISLLGDPKWKNMYYRILAKSNNNELTLYIIYHLYNRRQMTNIPANYQSQVQNFVFSNNL